MSAVSSSRTAFTEFDSSNSQTHADEQQTASTSTKSASLHQLCELLPLSGNVISASTTSTAERHSPKCSSYSQQPLLGRTYKEQVNMPRHDKSQKSRTHVTWSNQKLIQEVPLLGTKRTFPKNTARAIPNPWRRYGALSTLCHIGGWITKTDRPDRRRRRYFYVKPGTADRHPPDQPKISLKTDKYFPGLKLSTSASVEEQAALAAVHMRLCTARIKTSNSDSTVNAKSTNNAKFFDTTTILDSDGDESDQKSLKGVQLRKRTWSN